MTAAILPMDVHTVATGDVAPYPGNARKGDVGAIAASLQTNGQYRTLVVQRSTGYILAGNHTYAAAQQLGWTEIAVQYVDVDDTAARKILLADNKTNDAADYDDQLLARLLAEVDTLEGTGYTGDEYDDLMALLEETEPAPAPETPGAPPPEPDPAGAASEPDRPLTQGDRLDGNTTWVASINEKHQSYATSQSRQLVLTYRGAAYVWVVRTLTDLARRYGTTNNADTIAHLLADTTGTTPPEPTPEEARQ